MQCTGSTNVQNCKIAIGGHMPHIFASIEQKHSVNSTPTHKPLHNPFYRQVEGLPELLNKREHLHSIWMGEYI